MENRKRKSGVCSCICRSWTRGSWVLGLKAILSGSGKKADFDNSSAALCVLSFHHAILTTNSVCWHGNMGRNGLLWQSWCHSLGRVDAIYITHCDPFFCLFWRNLPWFLGTNHPASWTRNTQSFDSLIQGKFQPWVLQTRYNKTMPSNMFFFWTGL